MDDLLDVSRITRGKINLNPRSHETRRPDRARGETVEPLIQARGQVFQTEIGDQTLEVHGDWLRLTQVIGNVLSNAAKYTEARRAHRAEGAGAGRAGGDLVRDNGIGIAPDRLPRIFDLFTQFQAQVEGQAGSASGSRWCGAWSRCTVARSAPGAMATDLGVNSSSGCPS